MIRRDISRGVDPVPVFYNLTRDVYLCSAGGRGYEFPAAGCPFTLDANHCVDRALVERHG